MVRAGLSDIHGPRCSNFAAAGVPTNDDVEYLYGLSMTQYLEYAEYMFVENTSSE